MRIYAEKILLCAFCLALFLRASFVSAQSAPRYLAPNDSDAIFRIGLRDSRAWEFGRNWSWTNLLDERRELGETMIRFVVGESTDKDWSPVHHSTGELNGDKSVYEIEFHSAQTNETPLQLVVGLALTHPMGNCRYCASINGVELEKQDVPVVFEEWRKTDGFDPSVHIANSVPIFLEIPTGALVEGTNRLRVWTEGGNWLFYDYLALRVKREPLAPLDMVSSFKRNALKDVERIVFAVRRPGSDPHWYANFGYYPTFDVNDRPFEPHGGGALRVYNVSSGEFSTLLDDPEGAVRDPAVSYDGKKILFSYLKKGTEHYNLYEIDADGSNLRQLTFGDRDDIEPCYLPNDDIVFCSTRCDRFVQCWLTSVATIYRCGPNGEDIRPLSFNVEQDNTPNMLPNGQLCFTRWEYVDRSQIHYHHLWVMNTDGTRQSVLFGNRTPDNVFIDARAIPNSDKLVLNLSPGHGITDHRGFVSILDPKRGPDEDDSLKRLTGSPGFFDPYAFSETEFMASTGRDVVLLDDGGVMQTFFALSEEEYEQGARLFEPRPIEPREREPEIAELEETDEDTGTLILSDIYAGRRMKDVPRGTVKELLVLETLPEPIHYSGGMDQISSGGTFTLERVVGTIPVSPDGAAAMKLPAERSFLFVALDEQGRAVKRMHSFTSVMRGETTSCIGCHETRVETPGLKFDKHVFDVANKPIEPTPVEGIPDVFDFPRDIQPLLDKHCVECHNPDRKEGGVDLCGDRTPLYTRSYWNLSIRNMFGDNRNRPKSDFPPYEIGSQASALYKLICGGHQGVSFSDEELKTLRFWLETGAPYAGTYAANASGLIGWYYMNELVENDKDWRETVAMSATIEKRCDRCHNRDVAPRLPHRMSDAQAYGLRQVVFNLSRPEKSEILLAPLAKEQGGWGLCREEKDDGTTSSVFEDRGDADYQSILAGIQRGRDYIQNESQRFSTEPFVPNPAYIKAMKRYGVLPEDFDINSPVDAYELDRKYWDKFDVSIKK